MTRFHLSALLILALAILLGAARPAHAAESYDNCTGFITSIPATINTQGTWCLKQDLATAITSGVAITVNANNITIDCNDFKLGGLAAGAGTQTFGIYSTTQSNTTIRHCNIRGFYRGIYLSGGGGGNIIEDNRFDGNTWMAADTHGDGSVIRRNRVFDTGGTTVVSFGGALAIVAYDSVDILDNTVSGAIALAGSNNNVYGIYTNGNPSGTISGNRVRSLVKDGTGVDYAIYNTGSGRIALHDNDLTGDVSTGSVGIICDDTNSRVQNSRINGFATAISGCYNAGGTDITP
jgi:parallel beta-helix repeat protein